MSGRPRLAPRLAVIVTIWTLLHLYIGSRLVGGAAIPWPLTGLGWVAVLTLAWLPFVGFAAGRSRLAGRRYLEGAGYLAMGLSSLLIVLVAVAHLLRLGDARSAILGGAALMTAVGLVQARHPRVVRVTVPIRNLPADLAGLRIVQLSDLHVGPTIRRRFVDWVVDATNALAPDLVAVTGDVADGLVPDLRDHVAPLGRLRAPLGRFFVTGNHEYYWDPSGWMQELERLGLTPLPNAHRLVVRGTGRLLVAGVTDHSADADPYAALAGAPESDVRILLAHQPRSAHAARAAGFDLQISGHTHGGQFFPFNLLVRLFQPFVAGLHRLEEMWLYVSRGTGYWGPPLRLGAPPEITVLELIAA